MDLEYVTARMADNAEVIRALAQGVAGEQARWRPDPTSWSILEVINHLYDEEIEDFRTHLDVILRQTRPWPSIDPQGWITARRYNERDLEQSLEGFMRAEGIAHLAERAPISRLVHGVRCSLRGDHGRRHARVVDGSRSIAYASARRTPLGLHDVAGPPSQGRLCR
jgi:hypothetical protein